MGAVFLAEQLAVGNRPVALKILLRKLLDDPEFLMRFHNEAGSTGRIRHPNVVTIYESDQAEDGTPYIAMEYLEGKTLRQVLKVRGELSIPECVEITQQVARGLNAAHKLGIIHRDLKPDNIFLTQGDEGELHVKVVDFGIAKLLYSATHTLTGVMLGTPAYMSAEQAAGMHSDELDMRSDVYSLGIVAFEMLTGRVPFDSDTPLGYVRKHMVEDPPALRSVKPDLNAPEELERVIRKVLHKNRDQRYSSTIEFAREFVEALQPSRAAQSSDAWPLQGNRPSTSASSIFGDLSLAPSARDSAGVDVQTPPPRLMESLEGLQNSQAILNSAIAAPASPASAPAAPKVHFKSSRPRPEWLGRALDISRKAGIAIAIFVVLLAAIEFHRHRVQTARADMIYIPGGTFMMGRDKSPDPAENPAHSVTVAPFYIDRTPVTNAEYAGFVRATRHAAPPSWTNGAYPAGQDQWPVTDVTWNDAQAYAQWKGKRLPTEAEWEFTARGSDGRLYPWGNNFRASATNSSESKLAHPQPVGSHPDAASPSGVLDMSGNVWQWCQDAYQPYQGQHPTFEIPVTAKVMRGGSFDSDKNHVTTTARNLDLATSHSPKIGFRCAGNP